MYSATPQDASEDAIEDLAEGLDVLLILERAYERALKAHVIAPSAQASTPSLPASSKPEPLLTGFSTALLAVLDSAGSHMPTPEVSVVADTRAHDVVIRIAHLGDCMGMLVHGDDIVWHSKEMWWAVRRTFFSLTYFLTHCSQFNTPLQLRPASSTLPSTAQVITLPMHADDILILASDGLSDNIWDEDVLDKVMCFQHSLLKEVQPSAQHEGFVTVPDVTWSNIGALHATHSELQMAVVQPICRPELFRTVGIDVPAGMLLWGPPGCRKTLLAKAVANESQASFISVKGPELLNKVHLHIFRLSTG